jgi:hypothetical protein
MKRLAMLFGVLLLAVAGFAADVVKIEEVGLNYYQTMGGPTPLRLQVSNPRSETLPLTIQIRISPDANRLVSSQITKTVTLGPQEIREVELPIIVSGKDSVVDVSAIDEAQQHIGFATTEKTMIAASPAGLVAVLCADPEICSSVQGQIMRGGSPQEIERKSHEVKFAVLLQPRSHWWAYGAARAVVVAAPMAGFSSEQKQALEQYLRSGGNLILVEHEVADESFLAPYRHDDRWGPSSALVGKGTLYRASSVTGNDLEELFTDKTLEKFIQGTFNWQDTNDSRLEWLEKRVGPHFELPKLRWILISLGTYVFVLGAVNFALLRRFRRLEWGWVTIALCSLLFSGWFYASNYHRGPRAFEGTDLAILWMDPSSPMAFANYDVSMSSPKRTKLIFSVGGDAVLQPGHWTATPTTAQDVYTSITDKYHVELWQVLLDEPQKITVPMLRWSAHDVGFSGFQTLAGSVHCTAAGVIRNDTGLTLSEAVVVDGANLKLWALHSLQPGQEVDLSATASQPLRYRKVGEAHLLPDDLSLTEGVARRFGSPQKVFVGLIDTGTLPVELNERNVTWRKASLVVVPLS